MFPVKCFTCGMVIADKYRFYLNEVAKQYRAKGEEQKIIYLDVNSDVVEKTIEGQTLDLLKVTNVCCRRHFLTHTN